MKSQEIKFNNKTTNYSVLVGKNIFNILPKRIEKLCPKTKKVALIFDNKVPLKFKKMLKRKLKSYNLIFLKFEASEKK